MVKFCCDDMESNVWVQNQPNKGGHILCYVPRFNEYGLLCSDYVSIILIRFCPWCGKTLPESLRKKWFNELEQLGYETPLFDDTIPLEYQSDEWWNK